MKFHPHFDGVRRLGAAALLCFVLFVPVSSASESPSEATAPAVMTLEEAAQFLRVDAAELERLAGLKEIPARKSGSSWRFNREALLAWLNGDWTLIASAVPSNAVALETGDSAVPNPDTSASVFEQSLSVRDMTQVTGAGSAVAADQDPTPIGEAPEERTADDVFLRDQRVLLAPGELAWEVGQFYSSIEDQQLAFIDDTVDLATVERLCLESGGNLGMA